MKTVEETRRELFEAKFPLPENVWWHDVQRSYIGLEGNAPWWLYHDRFQVWCAALDAVVIELPKPAHNAWHDYDQGFNEAHKECRAAINSTNLGLKIK